LTAAPSASGSQLRVALVHDYLNQYGGAERVLEVFHHLFPDAPVYTSLYDPETMPAHFRSWDIRTSFLQRVPGSRRYHRALLLLYPLAFESFDLHGYDVVISNSSAFAKGVITGPDTLHVSYCLTPMRFAWAYEEYVNRERFRTSVRKVLPSAVHYLRLWDVATANRVDRFIGISRVVVARIAKYYRREADLIMPPVDVKSIPFSSHRGGSFLVVSRLIPYKRIDLAVQACSRLGLPLTVVGDGRDRASLQAVAGPTVTFAGRVADQQVREALAGCGAFLFPGEEDFGIAPVEAMAAGRPVVAYAGGGALDTVVDGVTGRFFAPQTVEALADRLSSIDLSAFDPEALRAHAMRFDTRAFEGTFEEYVQRAREEHVEREIAPSARASV
jgi:glycosyltransferase involved in cell wall biosynthesis